MKKNITDQNYGCRARWKIKKNEKKKKKNSGY